MCGIENKKNTSFPNLREYLSNNQEEGIHDDLFDYEYSDDHDDKIPMIFKDIKNHNSNILTEILSKIPLDENNIKKLKKILSPVNPSYEAHYRKDKICEVCKVTGRMIFCQGCKKYTHLKCSNLKRRPSSGWHCQLCIGSINNKSQKFFMKFNHFDTEQIYQNKNDLKIEKIRNKIIIRSKTNNIKLNK